MQARLHFAAKTFAANIAHNMTTEMNKWLASVKKNTSQIKNNYPKAIPTLFRCGRKNLPAQKGEDTNLTGVEIKSGSTVASDLAPGLSFFQKVSGTALAHAEILHGGTNSLPCGIARAVPWTRLAEKKCFANL